MRQVSSLIAGLTLLIASILIVAGLYRFTRFWMGTPESTARYVFYEVKKKTPTTQIIKDLENLGVIADGQMFYWYGRITGKLNKFKAGDYRFSTAMKPDEVMNIIMSGVSYGYPLTVPEGYTMFQIAGILEKLRPGDGAQFLELCQNREFINNLGMFSDPPKNLEGFLFPETYFISRTTPVSDLIRQMVKKYRAVFDTSFAEKAKSIGMTEYQVVTLASVVERETGDPKERPMVASVFHNRLKKRMKLQSDPTVIYGIKNYSGNLKKKDLLTPHPYNTYTNYGLPAGPIGNPGKEALLATLQPAESKYLYFVSHNDGTHEFTETYEAHRQAVTKFQLDPKAREGRSWRELTEKLTREKQALPTQTQ